MTIKRIPIAEINTSRTQTRAAINKDTVAEYAERMAEGDVFPPVKIFSDGKINYLSDGFHRVAAALKCGYVDIEADIEKGDWRKAWLSSLSHNLNHGVRYSNQDKRHFVSVMVNDDEWKQWSNNQIAKLCGVSHTFVDKLRPQVATVATSSKSETETNRTGSDGKQYPVKRKSKSKSNGNHAEDEGETGFPTERAEPVDSDESPLPTVRKIMFDAIAAETRLREFLHHEFELWPEVAKPIFAKNLTAFAEEFTHACTRVAH